MGWFDAQGSASHALRFDDPKSLDAKRTVESHEHVGARFNDEEWPANESAFVLVIGGIGSEAGNGRVGDVFPF